jgi:hypothetical protein
MFSDSGRGVSDISLSVLGLSIQEMTSTIVPTFYFPERYSNITPNSFTSKIQHEIVNYGLKSKLLKD